MRKKYRNRKNIQKIKIANKLIKEIAKSKRKKQIRKIYIKR